MSSAIKAMLVTVATLAAVTVHAPNEQPAPAAESAYPRFVRDTTDDLKLQIVTDHKTGCRYLMADASGMTPLLKADGTPDCKAMQKSK